MSSFFGSLMPFASILNTATIGRDLGGGTGLVVRGGAERTVGGGCDSLVSSALLQSLQPFGIRRFPVEIALSSVSSGGGGFLLFFTQLADSPLFVIGVGGGIQPTDKHTANIAHAIGNFTIWLQSINVFTFSGETIL